MIITEKKNVVGWLLTQGQEYPLLDLYPRVGRDLPFLLREHSFQFYVVVEGFAQYIVVSRGSFAIIPLLEPDEQEVRFVVEGEEEQSESYAVEIPKFEKKDLLEARIDLAAFYKSN